jgi:hypothetical protein
MAPLLFYLRASLKRQGKKGEGFGPWVDANLSITRRTADLWANEWGIKNGKLKKRKATSRKLSKGWGTPAQDDVYNLVMAFSDEAERTRFDDAVDFLGLARAQSVIYKAVVEEYENATAAEKANATSDTPRSASAHA